MILTEPLEHTCYGSYLAYVVLSECTQPCSHPGTLMPTAVGCADGPSLWIVLRTLPSAMESFYDWEISNGVILRLGEQLVIVGVSSASGDGFGHFSVVLFLPCSHLPP